MNLLCNSLMPLFKIFVFYLILFTISIMSECFYDLFVCQLFTVLLHTSFMFYFFLLCWHFIFYINVCYISYYVHEWSILFHWASLLMLFYCPFWRFSENIPSDNGSEKWCFWRRANYWVHWSCEHYRVWNRDRKVTRKWF